MTENTKIHQKFADFFNFDTIKNLLLALSYSQTKGNVCLDLSDDYLKILSEELQIEFNDLVADKENLLTGITKDGRIKRIQPSVNQDLLKQTLFWYDDNFLYTSKALYYELGIVQELQRISKVDEKDFQQRKSYLKQHTENIQHTLAELPKGFDDFEENEKPDWQLIAGLQTYLHNLSFITGGPGTGKTTTVAKLLYLLKDYQSEDFALAAPTGKAAERMKTSLLNNDNIAEFGLKEIVENIKSTTVHRLLGARYETSRVQFNRQNKLPFKVIIVDEVSMIDIYLMKKLLEAAPANSRLILLGDPDQLASVETGSLLGDLTSALAYNINQYAASHIRFLNEFTKEERRLSETDYHINDPEKKLDCNFTHLTKTYRYNSKSSLGKFAKNILNGHEIDENFVNETHPPLVIDTHYEETKFDKFIDQYVNYLKLNDPLAALQAFQRVRVLCATNTGTYGVYEINSKIEQSLRKKYNDFQPTSGNYHNRPIIIQKNQAEFGLNNGDIGIIRKHEQTGDLMAYFQSDDLEQSTKIINPAFIDHFQTAFAMTIHKSQGSEFEQLLILLSPHPNRVYSRQLLYTAITRGKTGKDCQLLLQSSLPSINYCIKHSLQRISGLNQRF